MPKGACVLLAVFQPVDLVMPNNPFPLGCVSHALLLVALVWIARAVWRGAEIAETAPVAVPA
jgi:hypothetical protein